MKKIKVFENAYNDQVENEINEFLKNELIKIVEIKLTKGNLVVTYKEIEETIKYYLMDFEEYKGWLKKYDDIKSIEVLYQNVRFLKSDNIRYEKVNEFIKKQISVEKLEEMKDDIEKISNHYNEFFIYTYLGINNKMKIR